MFGERECVLGLTDGRRDRLGEQGLGFAQDLGVEEHDPARRQRRILLVDRPHELVTQYGDRLVACARRRKQLHRSVEVTLRPGVRCAASADLCDASGLLAFEERRRDDFVELPGSVGAAAREGHVGEQVGDPNRRAGDRGRHRVVGPDDGRQLDDAVPVRCIDLTDDLLPHVVRGSHASGPGQQLGEGGPPVRGTKLIRVRRRALSRTRPSPKA